MILRNDKNDLLYSHMSIEEQTKFERFFVRSSMYLEKIGTISEDEIRLLFSSFCMTKRNMFFPILFL